MATKYARAGGGNWSADATWSLSSGGPADTVAPTAADDIVLDANSGNVTINSGATRVCRSINCTGYTGTLSHNASTTLDIGDGTAGAGNVALKFVSGMTYSIGSVNTSLIQFISTSVTQQTVDTGGKSVPRFIFGGSSNGNWILNSNVNCTSTNGFTDLTRGTLDFNGFTLTAFGFRSQGSATRTLTITNSALTLNGASSKVFQATGTNLTVNATGSTITCNASSQTFQSTHANLTFGTVIMSGTTATLSSVSTNTFTDLQFTGSGVASITSALTATSLTRTGSASVNDELTLAANIIVTGSLILNGNSGQNRLFIESSVLGVQRTITNTGATNSWSYVDFMDIILTSSYDASSITGGSGDCGGNSGITFTSPTTQTWSGSSSGNWGANAWTTRVPLPQDTASFNGVSFSASQTITSNMPRLPNISFTGVSGTPTLGLTSTPPEFFGSVTLVAGMNLNGSAAVVFRGRGNHTIDSAGKTWGATSVNFAGPAGTYTLASAFTATNSINHTHGTLDANGFNVTCSTFSTNVTTTRSLVMGSGTWSFTTTGTATFFNATTSTGLTFSGENATILLSTAGGNTRTFAGGGRIYGTLRYIVASSPGTLLIQGSNTFNTINVESEALSAKSLQFTSGTTTTITNWAVNGFSSSNRVVITASTGGSAFTLTKPSGVVQSTWLTLSDSTATGGALWYAGANSTNSSNNSGWIFADFMSDDNFSKAQIVTIVTYNNNSLADVLAILQRASSSKLNIIVVDNLQENVSKANILKTIFAEQFAKANILFVDSRQNYSKANILGEITNFGKGDILKLILQDNFTKASILIADNTFSNYALGSIIPRGPIYKTKFGIYSQKSGIYMPFN